jgi:hypothetical protein
MKISLGHKFSHGFEKKQTKQTLKAYSSRSNMYYEDAFVDIVLGFPYIFLTVTGQREIVSCHSAFLSIGQGWVR